MLVKRRMDWELLAEHSEGIIATTGCPSGEVQTGLRLGQVTERWRRRPGIGTFSGRGTSFLSCQNCDPDHEVAQYR